ncbi:hypothetical protein Sjap_000182 [Stephania japonica]|uniref:Wax synthase domain-containing protein n=1 Tax=Stephania japonica TaxID=461633 RepID=A0AAP0KJX6_9MAGN
MENCTSTITYAVHDEMKSFMEVFATSIASLIYCYFISFNISKGKTRLISLIPVIILFTLLPLKLNTITLIGTIGSFHLITIMKLVLFAFGHQPLQSNPPMPLTLFICIAYLPIKISHKNTTTTTTTTTTKLNLENQEDPSKIESENEVNSTNQLHPFLNLIQKTIFQALLWILYKFTQHMQPKFMLAYYCFYVYISAELLMATVSVLAWALLGLALEPHFNKPYMATSLQDFWGRRWNLMASNALRSLVYEPLKRWVSRSEIGAMFPRIIAVMGTFVVSGLVHEIALYYHARTRPSWEMTGFFVLQGLVVIVEIVVKKVLLMKGIAWRMNRVVSRVLVVGFVMLSAMSLFFPPVLKCNAVVSLEREIGAMVEPLKCSLIMLISFVNGK